MFGCPRDATVAAGGLIRSGAGPDDGRSCSVLRFHRKRIDRGDGLQHLDGVRERFVFIAHAWWAYE